LTTTNYVLKANGTTLGNSLIFDNGTNVGIGNTNTSYTLDVSGTLRNTGNAILASTSGLVGIGTTAPSLIDTGYGTLELNGTSGSGIKLDVNGGTTGYIYSASGLMNIYYTTGYFSISSSGNTERMRITSTGNVGIGTNNPAKLLDLAGDAFAGIGIYDGTNTAVMQWHTSDGFRIVTATAKPIVFFTNNAERMRILSGGNVGIGTSTPQLKLDIQTGSLGIYHNTTGSNGAQIYLGDSNFQGGSYATSAPGIGAVYNSGSSVASDLGFYVYTGSEASRTERMRIVSNGRVMVNTTDSGVNALLYASASSAEPYPLGSKATTSSQGLVGFFDSTNSLQGNIFISGTTVSYNSFLGSHWSQLSDNSKLEILTGTILEAINELCEWDNVTDERLAKVKISDTIESKNVYGVFSNWDNTDDYNDMYVAAVGAGFVRVNSSSIVSMGDLLQSNGDGTAKIQSDDIMRSSTIAKVTSTQKIETYPDGSYLIAATLHCG
jgi:hypothetical protein